MKLGIFAVADHYPEASGSPDHTGGSSLSRLYGELLEQVEAADALGFDSFWIAEHHFHEYGALPRPAVFLSAAAQRTRRIRLGTAVVALPFDNPLRTAEDFAMVDVLSGGRLNLGVGSGYLQHEFAGFNLDLAHKRARFDEALEVLLRAWSGERFSFAGEHFQVRDVQLNVRPLQQPHPPLWVATLRPESAPHVAARGLPVMLIPYATTECLDEIAATMKAFRSAYQPRTGQSTELILPFGLHTHCADTTERARREARGPMERYVGSRLYAKKRPFDQLIEKDLIAVGDPDEIVRVARRYQAAGLTHFLAMTNFGAMPHESVLRSMELLARAVMPRL